MVERFAVRMAGIAFALLLSTGPVLAKANCNEPQTGTKDVPVLSPPVSEVVIGAGRLQFYSAPYMRCRMNGVFIVPGDQVISYAQTANGWSSVMYSNPKTGNTLSGWVTSSRLKEVGTIGPK
jgi:hypothetical protein